MFLFEIQLCIVVLLDLLFGDPRWLPHPVRLIGLFCVWSEKIFRKIFLSPFVAGLASFIFVLSSSVGLTMVILLSFYQFSALLAQVAAIILLYSCLAARGLLDHSRAVFQALTTGTLEAARLAVSMIVGRDTTQLDRHGIIRACVETVAENMVDGVTAPLFYAVLLSLAAPVTGLDPLILAAFGAMGYKAVNTMDSMFGYKNEKYLFFGKTAAIIDDLVNWLPARLSGLLLIPAACLLGLDWKNAFSIFRRDRLAHASPNAAHPESAVAGALGVELGGASIYFGNKMIKPVIGDDHREVESKDILRTNHLMLLGSFLFLAVILLIRFFIILLLK